MKTVPINLKCTLLLLLSLFLSACVLRPYKFDIQQGNVITPEKVAQIQPGMSPEQVEYVLGTPLLNDVFHTERWDYIFYEKPGYKKPTRRHLAVYFADGKVVRVSEDPLPNSSST